jgi:hypothetical protein
LAEEVVAAGGEDCSKWACGSYAAGFEEDYFAGDAPYFCEVVGDVEDAEVEGEEAGEDVVGGGVVEAGEGLVEQEQLGGGGEGTGEGDALAFSTGELGGAAGGEGFCAEHFEHGGDSVGAGFGGEVPDAEGYVFADGHVGEEAGLLGEESYGAAAWG